VDGEYRAVVVMPHRVVVAGASGSGKSTLARRLAAILDLPYVEIDSLFHGPNWEPRPGFLVDVDAFSAGPRWIMEWQYSTARDLLASRADLLIWLDLPRRLTVWRAVRRTVLRRVRREALWNGNREPGIRAFFTDPDHIVRWAWRTHADVAPLVIEASNRYVELVVVRLRSRAEVERWVSTVSA
jgi:adenylate kinase family enzyme